MTELLLEMLKSEIFWKALAALLGALFSLPAVQKFREQLRRNNLDFLWQTARDVGTDVFLGLRKDLGKGGISPDEARDRAVQRLRKRLSDEAPRLARRIADDHLVRLINDVFHDLERREAQKPAVPPAGPGSRTEDGSGA